MHPPLPSVSNFAALYRRAFLRVRHPGALEREVFENPEPDDALVIARALLIEGDLGARRLAEEMRALPLSKTQQSILRTLAS